MKPIINFLNSFIDKYFYKILLILGILYLVIAAYYWMIKSSWIFLLLPIASSTIFISVIVLLKKGELKTEEWLSDNPAGYYMIAMIIATFTIIPLGLFKEIDYGNDVLVEAHGLLFDLIIFGILLAIFDSLRNRKSKIYDYQMEIDSLRNWKSEEAAHKILGIIRKMNGIGHTKTNISDAQLEMLDMRSINLSESLLNNTCFYQSNLSNAIFDLIISDNGDFSSDRFEPLHFSTNPVDIFDNIEKALIKQCQTILISASFIGARLQRCNFQSSILTNADFTNTKFSKSVNFKNAVLTGSIFQGAHFDNPNFEGAEVYSDFLDNLKNWNITGHPVYDWYALEKISVKNHTDRYIYKMRIKPDIDKSVKII